VRYIIGIDGGGTKTEAIAYSLDGEELGRGYSGFGNLLLDQEKALNNIVAAVDECMESVEEVSVPTECVMIYAGLAGAESGNNKQLVEEVLKNRFNVRAKTENDAVIALAALLKGMDGILVISGTGSICYGIKNGRESRAGGWGHILGDEGSGYFIALQVFRRMAADEDSDLGISTLSRAFMNKLEIEQVDGIKKFIYSSQKGAIAAFAPIIVEFAQKGDEFAKEILNQAGRDLAKAALKVYKKLGFEKTVSVGIKGSILTHVSMVREEFEKELSKNIEEVKIIDEEVSPSKGAYYLALKEL
jgi:N-acetylglucosamine kinase-like BadF-type ATPase